ncbi:MAG: hypothetical protein OXC37_04740 [Bdellovibrionaceae bacterium]|nr:hypothetical protein [Pseudobdellovibrionaceae bacterium]
MKLPVSKLSSKILGDLFEKSSLKEQHFFPRKVPNCSFLKKESLKLKELNKHTK